MMIKKPLVFVVILNWNGKKYLTNCFKSLEGQTYPNYRVIMVDNAFTDGSVEYVRKNFPWVTVIQNTENMGFAEGNNIGIKHALKSGAKYICLLNNDTVAEKSLLEEFVKVAENDETIGIVGSKILDIRNRKIIQEVGATCDIFGFPLIMYAGQLDYGQYAEISEVFYVSGCAMLIRDKLVRTIGYFDSKYFIFAEDLDFCWRAWLAGHRVVVNSKATVYHYSGGSIVGGAAKNKKYRTSPRRVYLRERNTLRTLVKNYSRATLVKIVPLYLCLIFAETMFFMSIGSSVSLGYIRAILWNMRNLKETLCLRYKVQRIRKVSDEEIMKKMFKGIGKLKILKSMGIPRFEG